MLNTAEMWDVRFKRDEIVSFRDGESAFFRIVKLDVSTKK